MQQANSNDKVSIHYEARLTDGTRVASSENNGPVECVIGSGTLIPGVEEAVQGMAVGEKKTVNLPPEEAFGPFHDELVVALAKDEFPDHSEVEVGMQFRADTGGDTERIVTIVEVSEDAVVVDGNHPLAGKEIAFDLELVAIH